MTISICKTVKTKGFVSVEQLAKNWKIGLEVAKKTVDATTQLAVRDFTDSEGGK
jgi:ribosomal protein S25